MGAFDALAVATGTMPTTVIPPEAEICPNNNCRFFNLAVNKCALAECRYTVPEVVTAQISRRCQICGGVFNTDAVGIVSICPRCVSDIRDAIAKKHNPGDD